MTWCDAVASLLRGSSDANVDADTVTSESVGVCGEPIGGGCAAIVATLLVRKKSPEDRNDDEERKKVRTETLRVCKKDT